MKNKQDIENTRLTLTHNWFYNLKYCYSNQSILLISMAFNEIQIYKNFIISLTSNNKHPIYPIYEDNNRYIAQYYAIYILDGTQPNLLNEIRNETTKNIIIFSLPFVNYFENFNKPILLPFVGYLNCNRDLLLQQIEQCQQYPNIEEENKYLFYLEKFPIIKLLETNSYTIIDAYLDYLFNYLKIFPLHPIINNTAYQDDNFHANNLIFQDILLLKNEEILTSRLAIVLYRLSFLNLQENKTRIGIYFRDKLKRQSKTLNLQTFNIENLENQYPDLSKKSFRGYELKIKPKTEKEVRIEIAKNLLKYKVDGSIIAKATKLSVEEILTFIQQ